MYDLFIKIMYEQDFRKYTIQEISEMKAILEQFKEMFTTLFRDKKDKVESELIEYGDYIKQAYQEKKERKEL